MHLSKEESRAMVVSALIIASITGITFSMNKCSQHQSNESSLKKPIFARYCSSTVSRIFFEACPKELS